MAAVAHLQARDYRPMRHAKTPSAVWLASHFINYTWYTLSVGRWHRVVCGVRARADTPSHKNRFGSAFGFNSSMHRD